MSNSGGKIILQEVCISLRISQVQWGQDAGAVIEETVHRIQEAARFSLGTIPSCMVMCRGLLASSSLVSDCCV